MTTGKVKFFDKKKGFGFIVPDEEGKDVYVNATDVEGGMLSDGDSVSYEITTTERGPRAVNVKKE
jgi:CspA family cold shock protein